MCLRILEYNYYKQTIVEFVVVSRESIDTIKDNLNDLNLELLWMTRSL